MTIDVRTVRAAKVFNRDDGWVKLEPTMPAGNAKIAIVTAKADVAIAGSAKERGADTPEAEPVSLVGTGQHGKTNDCCHRALQSSIDKVFKIIFDLAFDEILNGGSSSPQGGQKITHQDEAKSQEHENEKTQYEPLGPPNLLFAN